MKYQISFFTKIACVAFGLALVLGLTGCDIFHPPVEGEPEDERSETESPGDLRVLQYGDSIVGVGSNSDDEEDQDDEEIPVIADEEILVGEIDIDQEALLPLQNGLAENKDLWRLDPEQVLVDEKTNYGFYPKDKFVVVERTAPEIVPGYAVYAMAHGKNTYLVTLIQPFQEAGRNSIWVWRDVKLAPTE